MNVNAPVSQFPLLPLPWWQNPYVLGGVGSILICCGCLVYYGIKLYQKRNNKPLRPSERWVKELGRLEAPPSGDMSMLYDALIRIAREYAQLHVTTRVHALTDQELLETLKAHQSSLPHDFYELMESIIEHACHSKFAHQQPLAGSVQVHIKHLIRFLQQHQP